MRRLLQLAIFTILFSIIPTGVAAQSIEKWTPVCLDKVTHCGDHGANERCEPLVETPDHRSSHWGHRAQIDVRGLNIPANQDVIFVECIKPWPDIDLNNDTQTDWFCTSGFEQTDYELFCGANPNVNKADCNMALKWNRTPEVNYGLEQYEVTLGDGTRGTLDDTYAYYYRTSANLQDTDTFQKLNESSRLSVDTTGTLNASYIEAQSYSVLGHRKYLLFYTGKRAVTPTVSAQDASIGGQQQATLGFDEIREVVSDSCTFTSVGWDPYGRVFDSISLEPIPFASVQLLQQNPQGQFDAGYANTRNRLIINPFPTGASGLFVFYVEDGDYHLKPSISGYTMPFSGDWAPDAIANSIYSNFYYTDSVAIEQQGAIEHRDIPLIPADNIGKSYNLAEITKEIGTDSNGNMVIEGTVSHPFAEMFVEQCKLNNGVEVCSPFQTYTRNTGGPDKDGAYRVVLDQSRLNPGDYFKPTFRKINLQQLGQNGQQQVQSATTVQSSSSIDPIPSYIEGFAYDAAGNLLTGGYAVIYPQSYRIPIEIAAISSTGYYKITSERLPKEPFTIQYIAPGRDYKLLADLRTSDFIEQNKEFIIAETVSLYTPVTEKTNPRRTVTPAFLPVAHVSPVAQNSKTSENSQPAVTPDPSQAQTERNPMLLAGAVLLLLLGGAGALLAVYIYKKRSAQSS
ncbi:hypothetical protein KBD81_00155 [Candidatus Woesebacteria bacterium]|nr:hypothetical protein [Candidatus Woesebacteria bacterium]